MAIWKKPTDTAYLENTLNKNILSETLGIEITHEGEDFVDGMPVDRELNNLLVYCMGEPQSP